VTPIVGQKDNFLRRAGPIIGDVKEIAVEIEQPHAALFFGNVFADHDHAIGLLTSRGLVFKLGHIFVLEAQHFIATLDNDFLFHVLRFLTWLGFDRVARWSAQSRPRADGQLFRQGPQVEHAIVAEYKANAWVSVPAIEVRSLGEVGVAAEKDTQKTAAKTSGHGAIESLGSALMTGAIAGTIDDAQDFAGIGQADEQRMITPGVVVGDVHAFFALPVGAHQGTVGVDAGLLEKIVRLLFPKLHPRVIEDVLEDVDFVRAEASAIIAGRGGIGNALGAEGIEKGGVVAAQFDVLETRAVAQSVHGEVEDVIGVGIWQVQLEKVQLSIDGFDQSDVLGKFVEQGNSAEGGAIDAVVELEVEVTAAAKDGLGAVGEFVFVEASVDDSLMRVEFLTQKAMASASGIFALEAVLPFASVRLLVYSLFHLKSFS
jgi:hypothetical protein